MTRRTTSEDFDYSGSEDEGSTENAGIAEVAADERPAKGPGDPGYIETISRAFPGVTVESS